jgi:hypothetical protein
MTDREFVVKTIDCLATKCTKDFPCEPGNAMFHTARAHGPHMWGPLYDQERELCGSIDLSCSVDDRIERLEKLLTVLTTLA